MKLQYLMQLPEHLRFARHYAALRPLSVDNMVRLVHGQSVKEPLRVRLRRLWCLVLGHDLVTDRWHRKGDTDWFRNKRYEIHIGCKRCPFVLTLDPNEIPEL
jgi:hypothetical protein